MAEPGTLRRSLAVAGFVVLFLAMTAGLFPSQRDAAIGNAGAAHSASSPAAAGRSTEDLVALGKLIFHDTPNQAKSYVGARLACSSCHLNDGTTPYAAPMTGIAALYPEYSTRAKRKISLKERINECFVRSENGRPVPDNGKEMTALVAYIESLSPRNGGGAEPSGRGLVKLPALSGSQQRGAALYVAKCAECHGAEGAGDDSRIPPLWGPESFNDGAGLAHAENMAEFVVRNMPPTKPGSLTSQEAFDVASYIHTKPRPKYNRKYDKY